MDMPKSFDLALTKSQRIALDRHFDFVKHSWRKGLNHRVMIAGQAWEPTKEFPHGYLYIGCLDSEHAKMLDKGNALAVLAERDALRAVLRDIHKEFEQTYDSSSDGLRWTASGSIPVVLMERAGKLLEGAQ